MAISSCFVPIVLENQGEGGRKPGLFSISVLEAAAAAARKRGETQIIHVLDRARRTIEKD